MEGDKNGKVIKKITITDCGEIERKVDDHAHQNHHWSNSNLTDVHLFRTRGFVAMCGTFGFELDMCAIPPHGKDNLK